MLLNSHSDFVLASLFEINFLFLIFVLDVRRNFFSAVTFLTFGLNFFELLKKAKEKKIQLEEEEDSLS